MFCRYCGKETESPICPDCAAKAQAEQVSAAPEAVQPAEVQPEVAPAAPVAEPVMDLGTEPETPKKKKSKKGLWISLVAILAVVGVLLYFLLPWSYMTTSAEDMFTQAETKALGTYTTAISKVYGALVKGETSATIGQYNSATSTLQLEMSDLLAAPLSEALKAEGISLSAEQLKNLSVSSNFTYQENLLQAGVSVKDMLEVQAFMNLSNSMLYLSIPQLNDQALEMNTSELFDINLAEMFSGTNVEMDESAALVVAALEDETFKAAMPSEQEFNAMLDRAVAAALSAVTNVEKSTITVTVNGVSQDQYVLTATLNEATLRTMLKEALKAVQNDATLKKMVDAVNDYILRTTGENYNLYGMVSESIPMLLTELNQPTGATESIRMMTYVNDDYEVLGRKFETIGFGEAISLSYNFVEDGNTSHYEFVLPEMPRISGTVVEDGDLTTTTIKVPVDGLNSPVTLTIKESSTLFSFRVTPPTEVVDSLIAEVAGNIGVSSSLVPNNISVELALEQPTAAQFNVSLRVLAGETSVIGLVSKNELSNSTVTLPQDNANVSDALDMMMWTYESYRNLPESLQKLGLSNSIIEDILDEVGEALF